jgi:2-desacetyl-2-hydroxyethyl bacteriochlorophyllide A dehydrogenase
VRAALIEVLPADELTLGDVVLREPEAGEFRLAVEACGICGTDLHILAGESYKPEFPFVLGHEAVGRVREVGADVPPSWLGRRVTMTLFEGCGRCALCASGDERLCLNLVAVLGVLSAWGGFAEEMLLPAVLAVDVPPALTSVEAATLVDAGATAANAAEVVLSRGVTSVLVLGGGPVGLLTAELLTRGGAQVLVVEPLGVRRAALEELGHVVATGLEQVDGPFDAVVDCTGVASVVQPGLSLLRPRGLFVVVGYAEIPTLDLAVVARKELRVQGIRSGSRAHLEAVLAAAALGEIRLPPISTWPLENINDAFAALRAGQVAGKAVIETTNKEELAWTS